MPGAVRARPRGRSAALLLLVLAVVLAAAGLGPAARADDELVGPPIGNLRYRAEISEAGDEDDYPGRFVAGDVLTVSVVASRPARKAPATLRPLLVLVDPDGIVRYAGVTTSPNGYGTALRGFRVDKGGLWAARVSGRDGTSGPYGVGFQVKPAPKTTLRRQQLGEASPPTRVHRIQACDGAVLTASLTWTKLSNEVSFRDLEDPSGADVRTPDGALAVGRQTTHGRQVVLEDVVLGHGAGAYVLRTSIPLGVAYYDLTLDVRAPAKPVARRPVPLHAAEPFLDAAPGPLPGEAGDDVFFLGRGFSTSPRPRVRFGDALGTNVRVSADGKRLDVTVPPRTGPVVVAVTVTNPDGQATRRANHFAYLPPPVVLDLVDAATGESVRQASAAGGRAVRLLGRNLERGYEIRVGPALVSSPTWVALDEYRFDLPAVAQGDWTVSVTDPFQRVGASDFSVFLKTPPAFAAEPYSPGALRVGVATTVTLRGADFLETDRLQVSGQDYPSTFVDGATRTFDLPELPAGAYEIRLVDAIGTVVRGPDLHAKVPPRIDAVVVVGGDVLGTNQIPVAGGTTVEVRGSDFLANDVVTLAGARVTSFVSQTSTRKRFRAPAAAAGLASLVVTDGAGQSATATDVLRYVGFTPAARVPAASSTDDLSALRGAAGDLDRDGLEDDVVLTSPLGDAPGSRSQLTRVLRGDASGVLRDVTSSAMPAAGGLVSAETFDGNCLAIGDVDGTDGPDVVLGGRVATGDTTYQQVRLLRNDGTGAFTLDLANSPPSRYMPYVQGVYYYYYVYNIYGPTTQKGSAQAVALGDVDNDGDRDIVVGYDHFQSRQVYISPAYCDFTSYSFPVILSLVYVQYEQYLPATRVYENRLGDGQGLVDASGSRLPALGTTNGGNTVTSPALHCRDLALANLDRDASNRLDLVVSWNDPLTVSPFGLKTKEAGGASQDQARVATRVFLNGGDTHFRADVTGTWLPAAQSPEYWQADRTALQDLNGDGYPELVLLSSTGLDAWTGTETRTRSALRVLRNDRTRFTDVTSTAIPAVTSQDDWRGDGLAIRDVDGDGWKDILVATRAALRNASGDAVPRLRVFFGGSGLTFRVSSAFQEPASRDTGEADDLLFVGDLGGSGRPVLLELGERRPESSPSSTPHLRAHEWRR